MATLNEYSVKASSIKPYYYGARFVSGVNVGQRSGKGQGRLPARV